MYFVMPLDLNDNFNHLLYFAELAILIDKPVSYIRLMLGTVP